MPFCPLITFLRMKIFDNYAELNMTSLVKTGEKAIKKLSANLSNISNNALTNMSEKAEHVMEVIEENLFVVDNQTEIEI